MDHPVKRDHLVNEIVMATSSLQARRNNCFKQLVSEEGMIYKKVTPVFARIPRDEELDSTFPTWIINSENQLVMETSRVLKKGMVIVRNESPLTFADGTCATSEDGNVLYNEYVMEASTFQDLYGDPELLSVDFGHQYRKKSLTIAVPISPKVFDTISIHSPSPSPITIQTNWGEELVEQGGLLVFAENDSVYTISERDSKGYDSVCDISTGKTILETLNAVLPE